MNSPTDLTARIAPGAAMVMLGFLWMTSPALAGHTAIDFEGPGNMSLTSGQSFVFTSNSADCDATSIVPASCALALNGDLSSVAVNIGFTVKIGSDSYTTLYVNENGIVTFGKALPSGFSPAANFAALQTIATNAGVGERFIAPFYADLNTPNTAAPNEVLGFGGVAYGRGTADPSGPPFDLLQRVPALYVGWVEDLNGVLLNPIYTQVVLYSRDPPGSTAGNFDLRIRYGAVDADQYNAGNPPTGLAGFSFGPGINTRILSGPLLANSDYFFSFTGGTLPTDTDGDGVPDSSDNCPATANADQKDTDGDGVGDVCDNCPTTANPDQRDDNGNGIGNACEVVAPMKCDVDSDRDIDLIDISAILHSLRQRATGPLDPRDADSNGVINLIDAGKCALRCTRSFCRVK